MTPLLGPLPRGDRAFERLYRRHVGDVYRYSLALMRNQADAEDVTQTTFMNAYRAMNRGEKPESPRNWLIAIAHNVCRQRFRQAQRRVEEVRYEESVAEAFVPDADAPAAEDIRRALGHLAFNQRAALVMRELEGRSYAEIAAALDLSQSAVETLLFRARRALREQLEGSLTCREAEESISRQLDGRLDRRGKGVLRAHLRECGECATMARKQRAQRAAIRALGAVPVPLSLTAWTGSATAATVAAGGVGAGAIGLKVAAVAAAGAVAVGVGHEASTRFADEAPPRSAAPAAVAGKGSSGRAAAPGRAVAAAASARRGPSPRAAAAPKGANATGKAAAKARAGARGQGSRAAPNAAVPAGAQGGSATAEERRVATPAAAATAAARARAAEARANAEAKAKAKAKAKPKPVTAGVAPPTPAPKATRTTPARTAPAPKPAKPRERGRGEDAAPAAEAPPAVEAEPDPAPAGDG